MYKSSTALIALPLLHKGLCNKSVTGITSVRVLAMLAMFIMVTFSNTYSQEYTKEKVRHYLSGSTIEVVVPAHSLAFGNRTGIESASVRIQMDMNALHSSYVFGAGDSYQFEYQLSFGLEAYDENAEVIDGVFEADRYSLHIDNHSPEKVWAKDLADFIIRQESAAANPLNDQLPIFTIKVTEPQLTVISNNDLLENVRCFVELEIEYAPDVSLQNVPLPGPNPVSVNIIDKTAEFIWSDPYPFTLYQLEVLRLYNTVSANKEQEKITTSPDWSQAVSIDIPISEVFDESGLLVNPLRFSYTLGEGTGFYAWRVRPVGTCHKGGAANSQNFGTWSVYTENTTVELDKETLTAVNHFYFNDPDTCINSSFSRIFTEENKTREIATYADGLNQVRQTKTYLPSNNVTITAQSVTDYSGRPAVNTLPMPTEGKVDGYSREFFTSNQEVYTAANFENKESADRADETGEMNYYSNNPDPRIPNSDGVPFTQAAYYNDPLNRIKEEGGPTEMHMIKPDGAGKNTKYFYGTPSETELVSVFGKEAPNNHSVSKLVKVDPNNIATITYTSSDGKTLATCLSFYDADNDELVPLSNTPSVEVVNKITESMKTDWGFVSTKRIVLLQASEIKIDYAVKEAVLKSNCVNLIFDCHYTLDILAHHVETGTTIILEQNKDLSGIEPVDGVISIPRITRPFEAGTYVIEKRLKPGMNAAIDYEENTLKLVKPLVDLISGWLDEVGCEEQVDAFQAKLRNLSTALNSHNLSEVTDIANEIPAAFFTDVYEKALPEDNSKYYKETYSLDLYKWVKAIKGYQICDESDTADLAILRSTCCIIHVPVKWIRTFNYRQMPQLASVMTDIVPDFEGYAVGFFEDCEALDDFGFYEYMDGWGKEGDGVPHGTFNLMIYHMLMDKPDIAYTNNPLMDQRIASGEVAITEKQPELDDCGNAISEDWQNGIYTMKGLFECWQLVLSELKKRVCSNDLNIVYPPGNTNTANAVDSQEGGDTFNNNMHKGLKGLKKRRRKKITKKLDKKLKGLKINGSTSENTEPEKEVSICQIHLVKDFLENAGYSFVKILTPYDARPLIEDDVSNNGSTRAYRLEGTVADGLPEYFRYKMPDNIDVASYFNTLEFRKPGENVDFYYYPLSDWAPQKVDESGDPIAGEYLFKGIRNPVYAFKYFEYPQEGWITYQEIETGLKYDDPNDCFLIEGDFIKLNADSSIAKGPCCVVIDTDPDPDLLDYSFCYSDYHYPRLQEIYKEGDPRFGKDVNDQPYKLLVSDFDGEGRIRIEYDHHYWSMGQRYTFYRALSTYVEPEAEDWEIPYSRTCLMSQTPTTWYINSDENDNNLPELIMEEELAYVPSGQTVTLTNDYYRLDNTEPDRLVSEVEMDMASSIDACLERCSSLVPEFRKAIQQTLVENCYDIDGCLGGGEGTPYENVVPREDIEVMVSTLVNTCRSQCQLNTFSCNDIGTRSIKAPKTETGPTHVTPKLLYGMGGFPQEYVNCEKPLATTYNDAQYYDPGFTDNIPNVDIHKCKMDVDGITEDSYSWYQYSLLNQATNWDFELDLPSKCELLVLEAEDATEKQNCLSTTTGVNEFGNGDAIRFGKVDFGRGAVSGALALAVPAGLEGQQIRIWIEDENNIQSNIATLTTQTTGSAYSYLEQNITFNQPVTGVYDVILTGSGSGTYIANIDRLILKANPGTMSNMRKYTGCTTSTYLPPSEFEKETDGPADGSGVVVGAPVTSPAVTIEVEAGE